MNRQQESVSSFPAIEPRPPSRLPARRVPDLPARLNRARLVYLLGRSGQPLTDWIPLGMAAAVIGLMVLGAPAAP